MEETKEVTNTKTSPALKRIHRAALGLFAEKGAVQVNVSELAQAADVARGTIYNNLNSTDLLFEQVASQLEAEMHQRIAKSFATVADPAQRMANGIRFFIRRAHEEPDWGRFFVRFAFSSLALRSLWTGQPALDLQAGLEQRRYTFPPEQLASALAMASGSVLAAMVLVQEGHKTWREAGSDTAELVLKALGIASAEARSLSLVHLPLLPATD